MFQLYKKFWTSNKILLEDIYKRYPLIYENIPKASRKKATNLVSDREETDRVELYECTVKEMRVACKHKEMLNLINEKCQLKQMTWHFLLFV